jgi:NADH-quinone oxidoreductase subunit J
MPSLQEIIFFALALAILGSAIAVVWMKNAIHAALSLIVSLLSVSMLFITMRAEFLFATQLLVYTGGVMVLFLFVIMLVNVEHLEHMRAFTRHYGVALGTILLLFFPLAWLASHGGAATVTSGTFEPGVESNTRAIAGVLLTRYLLPFEIVSVLLLVAMVGAIVLSKKEI